MKKHVRLIGLLLCLSFVLCGLTACAPTSADTGYKAVFNFNYIGAPAAVTVIAGEDGKVDKPVDPTRDDYVFAYWSTNIMGTKQFDFGAPLTKNVRLFAFWRQTAATVTFATDGGSVTAAQSVEIGKTATRPSDPTREDYVFEGWYADAALRVPFDFSTVIERDTTVYAKWRQTVATVTFVFYGDVTESVKVDIGGTVARPSAAPTREDYAFRDWYADAACTEPFDFDAAVAANVSVYAGWKLVNATVTFDPNYDGAPTSYVKIPVGSSVTRPADPERTGWEFAGWCTDKDGNNAFDFTSPIGDNTVLYADWTRDNVTVTVDYNYSGADKIASSVEYESTFTEPSMPVRNGYAFIGWYNTAACAELDYFDFTAPVTDNVTVYAGWMTASSVSFDITYLSNDGTETVVGRQTTVPGRIVRKENIATPVRQGYYFVGWTFDKEGAEKVPEKYYSRSSVSLYAKWLKKYTFEAEYTYVTGKPGQGSSDNPSGVDIIQAVKDVPGNGDKMGISNGYYVGKLYYNGAFLEFDVTAAAAVDDAVLVLRLTPDLFDMIFNDNEYQVWVNDKRLKYGDLRLTGAIAQTDFDENGNAISGDMYKRPFEDYALNVSLALKKGENKIKLVTNNSRDHGGTFNAETPLVDCIYICSDVAVSWTKCYPENVGQTMADVKY